MTDWVVEFAAQSSLCNSMAAVGQRPSSCTLQQFDGPAPGHQLVQTRWSVASSCTNSHTSIEQLGLTHSSENFSSAAPMLRILK
ncbi:hypothetical protein PCASD_11186 [Puccinia coronata f. sp. avenae]|uniref:Uncharacterized protein n=1 Tax=Puccinia coronata f. sp. avenae TaxID=200324 RepID=A0A2N5UFH9_9BASI|nr:hypothetical protein PCASD_11186 [Puccinia coronata f. sp. avenae]